MTPKISIITVVFNASELLEDTILNISGLEYSNKEYIIIDGGSSDGTVDIILRHSNLVDKWISEPDQGLYHAMNKGLMLADGDYLWFINAGDKVFSPQILKNIFNEPTGLCDIYYGDTMIIDRDGNEIGMRRLKPPDRLSYKNMINGMVVCHQSVLVKKSIAPAFDISFRIASDYKWLLESLKKSEKICNTKMILTYFLEGGINKKNIIKSLKERSRIMIKEFGFVPVFFRHFVIAVRFFIFYFKNKRF